MINQRMTIDELKKTIDIHPATEEIIRDVEERYEKKIDFIITNKFNSHANAKMKIANNKVKKHTLIILENMLDSANYLIAHECMHVKRMMSADDKDKKLLNFNQNKINKLDKKEAFLISGVLQQIYNIPIDIKIENYLFENYPALRKSQRLYLEKDSKKLLSADYFDNLDKIPTNFRKYFNMSLAITYVYLKSLTPILGMTYKKSYKKHGQIIKLAKSIDELMIKDLGGKEDIKQIKLWAKHLGMEKFINWTSLDEVPLSHYLSY